MDLTLLDPPNCPPAPKLENFPDVNSSAYTLAPEPPKQLSPKFEYGDYPTVLRAIRTRTQEYNATTPPNLKQIAVNNKTIVDKHNEKVDARNKACDALWKAYDTEILKKKESKAESTFKKIF